jgi:hypothetical protein
MLAGGIGCGAILHWKAVWLKPVTVASLPQGAALMAVNRNSDQLFGFAFPQ